MTVATLQSLRDDEMFDLFWKKVENHSLSLDVDEPIHYPESEKLHKDMRKVLLSPNSMIASSVSESIILKH